MPGGVVGSTFDILLWAIWGHLEWTTITDLNLRTTTESLPGKMGRGQIYLSTQFH